MFSSLDFHYSLACPSHTGSGIILVIFHDYLFERLMKLLDAVDTPSEGFNKVMTVLLSTSQFIAGAIAIFLDNTIPGTRKERGLEAWTSSDRFKEEDYDSYDIPWLRKVTNLPFCKFCPISPAFKIKPKVQAEVTTKSLEESDL